MKLLFPRWVWIAFCWTISTPGLCYAQQPAASLPDILVSIRPLELILEEAFGELLAVETLLPANLDPHNVALRMSERRRLHNAQMFVWLGPEYELFLTKAAAGLLPEQQIIVGESKAIPWREFSEREHDHDHSGTKDVHFWLDPQYAAVVVTMVAEHLGAQYPQFRPALTAAASKSQLHWAELDADIKRRLAPYSASGFLVYHDAYQYFVERYQLKQVAAVNILPQQRLSATKMAELVDVAPQAACMVAQQHGRSAQQLAERLELPLVFADPIGSSKHIDSYSRLLESLTGAFMTCLQSGPLGRGDQ